MLGNPEPLRERDPACLDDGVLATIYNPGEFVSPPSEEPRSPLRVKRIGSWVVVEFVDGKDLYDANMIRAIGDQLRELVDYGYDRMVIDFGAIRYISSYMLAQIVWIHRRIGESQGALRLCQPDHFVRNLFRICHVDHILGGLDSESESLDSPSPEVRDGDRRKHQAKQVCCRKPEDQPTLFVRN